MLKLLSLWLITACLSIAQDQQQAPAPKPIPAPAPALKITIKGVPQGERLLLNGIYQPNAWGEITLPFLKQKIATKGLTDVEIAAKIEQSYIKNDIYVKPTIKVTTVKHNQIIIKPVPQKFIHIRGIIPQPKRLNYKIRITLRDVLIEVGLNNPKNLSISLTRNRRKHRYNLNEDVLKLKLYPNDQIELEKSLLPPN